LYFTGPLFITLLAAIFLGEQVGRRVIVALAVGFAGVLVMTASGVGSFEPAVLLPLVSAFTYAIAQVLARKVGATDSASVMTFFQNSIFLIGAALAASLFHGLGVTSASHPSLEFLVRPWVVPTVIDFGLMAACGVIAALGSTLLTHSYRITEANLVTVFEYTGLIWAPTWGFLIFGEALGPRVVAGILLILTAGLIVTLKTQAVAAGKVEPPGS
jgi:drug/metabolite transporter (DMT)-like permease